MRWVWWVVAAVSLGCGRQGGAQDGGQSGGATSAPCRPAALASAQELPAWKLPEGCAWRGLPGNGQTVVRSAQELTEKLDCKGSPPGVDFTASALLVTSRVFSPAQTGLGALDDGTTVTWVSRTRPSCPSEYPPMPVPLTVAVVVPASPARAFAEATCVGPSSCR